MTLPYICNACRTRIRRPLSSLLEPTTSTVFTEHNTSKFLKTWHSRRRDISGQSDATQSHRDDIPTGRYSRRPVLRPEHVISQLQRTPEGRSEVARHTEPRPRLPDDVKELVQKFGNLVKQGDRNDEAWNALQDIRNRNAQYQNVVRDLSKYRPFRLALGSLVLKNAIPWVESLYEETDAKKRVIRPSEIIRLFPELGEERTYICSDTIWIIATRILERQASEPQNFAALSDSMLELMTLWWLVLRSHLGQNSPEPLNADFDWRFLPQANVLRASINNKMPFEKEYETIFAIFVPAIQYRDHDRHVNLSRSSLITHHLLQSRPSPDEGDDTATFSTDARYAPFATLLDVLRRTCGPPATPQAIMEKLDAPFSTEVQDLYKAVLSRYKIPSAPTVDSRQPWDPYSTHKIKRILSQRQNSIASVFAGMNIEGLPTHDFSIEDDSAGGGFAKQHMGRLAGAIKRRDGAAVEALAQTIIDIPRDRPDITLTDQLYETSMLACMLLHKRAVMLNIWNAFLARGRKPTVRTFTMLMTGARHLRDVAGVEAFWQQMLTRKIRPDAAAWSTRIFGLLRAGEVDKGLAALVEMGRVWHKQVKSGDDADVAAKPTVVIMNSALSALAASRRADHLIPEVLAWGRRFDVQPDESTFNVLLSLAARSGQTEELLRLLEQMQTLGLKANSTTWTIIITDVLTNGSLDGLSSKELQDKIHDLLKSIDTLDGSSLDVKGYATLIDRLLKRYQNSSAAQAVLDHMRSKGLEPTSHIYTILLTAYFDTQPEPDFAAIDAMLAHVQSQNHGHGARLDDYFWDRLIEGHAKHHHTIGIKRCLDLLKRMTSLDHRPSWPSLGLVARALIERNDVNRLAQLVDDVRAWDRASGIKNVWHKTGDFGRVDFWRLVISTGILRAEGITRVSQVITPRARLASDRSMSAG